MGIGYWNTLAVAQGAGPNLTGSAARTNLLPSQASISLPAGYLAYAGQKLKIVAQGQVGNIVTTPGTLTLDVAFGSILVWSSGAMILSTTVHTTLPFWLEVDITARILGLTTVAQVMAQGRITSLPITLTSQADSGTPFSHNTLLIPGTAPALTTPGFDSVTTAYSVTLNGTWSLSNANAIQVQQYELTSTNWGG